VSVCPRNAALQQYLSTPSSFKASSEDFPEAISSWYFLYKCAIGLPQLKQRMGIIIEELRNLDI